MSFSPYGTTSSSSFGVPESTPLSTNQRRPGAAAAPLFTSPHYFHNTQQQHRRRRLSRPDSWAKWTTHCVLASPLIVLSLWGMVVLSSRPSQISSPQTTSARIVQPSHLQAVSVPVRPHHATNEKVVRLQQHVGRLPERPRRGSANEHVSPLPLGEEQRENMAQATDVNVIVRPRPAPRGEARSIIYYMDTESGGDSTVAESNQVQAIQYGASMMTETQNGANAMMQNQNGVNMMSATQNGKYIPVINPLGETQNGGNMMTETQNGANAMMQNQNGVNMMSATQNGKYIPVINPLGETQNGGNMMKETQNEANAMMQNQNGVNMMTSTQNKNYIPVINPLGETQNGGNMMTETQNGANAMMQNQNGVNMMSATQNGKYIPVINPLGETQNGGNMMMETQNGANAMMNGQYIPVINPLGEAPLLDEQPEIRPPNQRTTIYYYDPSEGDIPQTVYDGHGNPVDLQALRATKADIYIEKPGAPQLQLDWKDWNNEPQAKDQMIILSTVATMALLVGALSARRLRSRHFLSTCIENESLEDEVAYDTAYTTSGGYDTFGGPWKGDLEKFDV